MSTSSATEEELVDSSTSPLAALATAALPKTPTAKTAVAEEVAPYWASELMSSESELELTYSTIEEVFCPQE